MTDSNNNQPASKTPTPIAYHVRNRESGKGFWTPIGGAWAHKDGNGFIKVTRDLIRAGQLLKMEVLDHVIVGNGNFTSLRGLGYFYQP